MRMKLLSLAQFLSLRFSSLNYPTTWKTINFVLIHLMTRKNSTLKLKSHPNIMREPEYIFTNLIQCTHLYFSPRLFFKSIFHVRSSIS